MIEVERTVTVTVRADAAYAYLSDPAHLADFVPTMEHVHTEVVDGTEAAADAPDETQSDAPRARFFTDSATRTVEWAAPGAGLAFHVTVEQGTSLTSRLTIRVQADGEPEPATLEDLADRIVANLRRGLARR